VHVNRALVAGVCLGLVTAVPTIAVVSTGPVSANPPEPGPAAATATAASSYSVTLLTGDRVIVTAGSPVVRPGEGRDGVTFLAHQSGESSYVIPSDALALLAQQRLDRRLFDVTLLHQLGYHDQRDDLPLIVTHPDGAAPAVRALMTGEGAEVVHDLPVVDGMAVRVDKSDAASFWEDLTSGTGHSRALADGVSTVWLDGLVTPQLDASVPQVGAPAARDLGLDGTGVTVAVLDTGIDAHPDLVDRVVERANFTGDGQDRDLAGTGTHLASIIAGTGAASDGRHRGVAPGAELLDGKVCAPNRSQVRLTSAVCAISWVLDGMQWAAEHGAAIVSIGLTLPDIPPLAQAVQTLTDEYGVLVVAPSGFGPSDASIGSPAIVEAALAVGAVADDGTLAGFSGRGPGIDGALKPDLTAPGVGIVAASSRDGVLGPPGEPYTALSGTPTAAAHVAGAAAILAQQHPQWLPDQLKAALMASAAPSPGTGVFGQGAGRLDLARAVTQPVSTSPASVSFDRPTWPHDDDQPQTRTVTYRNAGDVDVPLDLTLTASGPDGEPPPDGFFTLGASRVTVPAGGSADVSLTADTGVGDVDGLFGGHLTATGPDGLVVSTPFGVDREVESYDVTLAHTGRDGLPARGHLTFLVGGERQVAVQDVPEAGQSEVTARLPAGDYLLVSLFPVVAGDGSVETTLLVYPRLAVGADQTVALDARTAEPVRVGVDDPAAVPVFVSARVQLVTEEVSFRLGATNLNDNLYTAQLGPDHEVPGLVSTVSGELAVPAPDGSVAASGTRYHLAWFVEGAFPTGFHRTAARRDLATVRADHAAQADGSTGSKAVVGADPDLGASTLTVFTPIDAPLTRTEYLNTDDGLEWLSLFDEVVSTDVGAQAVVQLDGEPTAYQRGRGYDQRWNYGVFGPAPAVSRSGDVLQIAPRLYGDAAGHVGTAPATGTVSVFRNGEPLATEPLTRSVSVPVPPEPADYRVELAAVRIGPAPLSGQTTVAWEFRSGPADAGPLPVSVVRFSPNLAPDNTVRAGGRPLLVPVSVDTAGSAGELASLTVEVSFDDGATWEDGPVIAGRYVLVHHPSGDGFVSLRATATDAESNRVEQTIVRAYEFR
jgi:subtilisin family serine protease